MPFDFEAYDKKCAGLTAEELQKEWNHYTRLISGGATSTAISGLAIPFTAGISTIGVALAAPGIHNSRKKRDIIEKHLQAKGTTHQTRKRDVVGSMAFSGTIGVVTLGVGSAGADSIVQNGAEHGIALCDTGVKIVTHAALDGAGMALEHAHTHHQKVKDAHIAFDKAGTFKAVADAKAAEAGYSIQQPQYDAQGRAITTGSSSSSAPIQMIQNPPPQYAYNDPLQPPPAYPSAIPAAAVIMVGDVKAPIVYPQDQQQQLPAPQAFDPYQGYYQQGAIDPGTGLLVAAQPVQHDYTGQTYQPAQPLQSAHGYLGAATDAQIMRSITPVPGVQPEEVQYHQQQQYPVQQQPGQEFAAVNYQGYAQAAPADPVPSPPSGVFEMAAMEKALPETTPSAPTALDKGKGVADPYLPQHVAQQRSMSVAEQHTTGTQPQYHDRSQSVSLAPQATHPGVSATPTPSIQAPRPVTMHHSAASYENHVTQATMPLQQQAVYVPYDPAASGVYAAHQQPQQPSPPSSVMSTPQVPYAPTPFQETPAPQQQHYMPPPPPQQQQQQQQQHVPTAHEQQQYNPAAVVQQQQQQQQHQQYIPAAPQQQQQQQPQPQQPAMYFPPPPDAPPPQQKQKRMSVFQSLAKLGEQLPKASTPTPPAPQQQQQPPQQQQPAVPMHSRPPMPAAQQPQYVQQQAAVGGQYPPTPAFSPPAVQQQNSGYFPPAPQQQQQQQQWVDPTQQTATYAYGALTPMATPGTVECPPAGAQVPQQQYCQQGGQYYAVPQGVQTQYS